MVPVTRLDGRELVVNAELIETLEATPDTVITLTTGRRLVVREPVEEIVRRVVTYRRRVLAGGRRSGNPGRSWRATPAAAGGAEDPTAEPGRHPTGREDGDAG